MQRQLDIISGILHAVRHRRTDRRVSQTRQLAKVVIDASGASAEAVQAIRGLAPTLQAVVRAEELAFGDAENATELEGVQVEIVEQVAETPS